MSDKWIYIAQTESNEVKGGRGTANIVVKCKFCSRENNMGINITLLGNLLMWLKLFNTTISSRYNS